MAELYHEFSREQFDIAALGTAVTPGTVAARRRGLSAGAKDFLAKPFERDQLLLCIAQHLDIAVEREPREPLEAGDTREDVYEMWRQRIIALDGTRIWIPSSLTRPVYTSGP